MDARTNLPDTAIAGCRGDPQAIRVLIALLTSLFKKPMTHPMHKQPPCTSSGQHAALAGHTCICLNQ